MLSSAQKNLDGIAIYVFAPPEPVRQNNKAYLQTQPDEMEEVETITSQINADENENCIINFFFFFECTFD